MWFWCLTPHERACNIIEVSNARSQKWWNPAYPERILLGGFWSVFDPLNFISVHKENISSVFGPYEFRIEGGHKCRALELQLHDCSNMGRTNGKISQVRLWPQTISSKIKDQTRSNFLQSRKNRNTLSYIRVSDSHYAYVLSICLNPTEWIIFFSVSQNFEPESSKCGQDVGRSGPQWVFSNPFNIEFLADICLESLSLNT